MNVQNNKSMKGKKKTSKILVGILFVRGKGNGKIYVL